jgi:hypothetical protein
MRADDVRHERIDAPSGMCETALVYHHAYRLPWASRSAALDPFRRRATLGVAERPQHLGHRATTALAPTRCSPRWPAPPGPCALHDYGYGREEALGYIALHSPHEHAANNPNAVYTRPLTTDDSPGRAA